jgi:trehalose-6-phosphatase
MNKTIVCDIDGTLCEIQEDFNYSIAKPNRDMIDFINNLYDKGATIYLYTGRHMKQHRVTETWLKKYSVKYHHIFYGKPVGDLYIDDLSVTPEEILKRKNGV